MSGIAIKITSLLIRTVSKPIANRIKAQAREHEGFRRICVGWAQYLHRVDIRLRLGLLNDPAKMERQAAREAEALAKKKRDAETPTVKTEAQTKADADQARRDAAKTPEQRKKEEEAARQPKIKPLSEGKAIDMGANFIAESFLFAVAVGTLFFDQYRSRKKETTRRNDVADKLAELEERDEAKNRRIDELERHVRELGGAGGAGGNGGYESWQWPWRKGQQEQHQQQLKEENEKGKKSTTGDDDLEKGLRTTPNMLNIKMPEAPVDPSTTTKSSTSLSSPAESSKGPAVATSAPEVLKAEDTKSERKASR